MASTPEVALRKRQQITKANRMMFVWIAGASVILGFSLVGGIFLWEKAQFNNDILSSKSATAKTMKANESTAAELIKQIQVRNTSDALRSAMAPGETEPIRVVLDALPSKGNSSAFGASLQSRFLNAPGLTIESLSVDPIDTELAVSEDAVVQDVAVDTVSTHTIGFSFSVSVAKEDISKLQELLQNLERSIRTVHMNTVKLERQGDKFALTVAGVAYFNPEKTAEMKEVTITPKNAKSTPKKTEAVK